MKIKKFFLVLIYGFIVVSCVNISADTGIVNAKIQDTVLQNINDDTINLSVTPPANKKVLSAKDIVLDSIPPVGKNINERNQQYIDNRIHKLIGKSMRKWMEAKGMSYPPQYVLFRVFKLEKEFEIWVGNSDKDSLQLIVTLQI